MNKTIKINFRGSALRYGAAAAEILLIGLWLLPLRVQSGDFAQYYSIYIVCAAAGILALLLNLRRDAALTKKEMAVVGIASVAFSMAVLMANYKIFHPLRSLRVLAGMGCCFLGGAILAFHILTAALSVSLPLKTAGRKDSRRVTRFYFACFGSAAAVFLLYFFSTAYPGYFTPDSFASLGQIKSGIYVNDHPFYYTMLIRLCMGLGQLFGAEGNGAVAVYAVVQILMMTAVFSYALVTLYQIGVPSWGIGLVYGIYVLLPYNLAYGATMWKDVLFGVSVLLVVVSLYRIMANVGASEMLNMMVFAIGSLLLCLMRTNGLLVYLCMTLVFLLCLRRLPKRLLLLMCVILLLAFFLTGPVLDVLGVGKTDMVETMAIPFQQVARVIALGYEVAPEDWELLDRVFYVDEFVNLYSPVLVDDIKQAGMRPEMREYFLENIGEYAALWLRLGKQYPVEYLRAWIEQTKGYWNCGYDYYIYYASGSNEALGIVRPVVDNFIADGFGAWFSLLDGPVIFQPLYGIGLQVWLLFACFIVNILKNRREFLLSIPIILIVVGLWLGTPVFSEFRYAYPVFLSVPVLLCFTFFRGKLAKK